MNVRARNDISRTGLVRRIEFVGSACVGIQGTWINITAHRGRHLSVTQAQVYSAMKPGDLSGCTTSISIGAPLTVTMNTERPPTIDPRAAQRWESAAALESPWLHEEVARRMEQRLQWIAKPPAKWVHWEPLRGGLQAHALLAKRYPKSECFVLQAPVKHANIAAKTIARPWWKPSRWGAAPVHFEAPPTPVQMLWANMALHTAADPQALMARWNQLLDVDGFLMFSCFGPDTLRELRSIYAQTGWTPPSHEFTDMHDWGDMLVQAGFAEPVMDMERITLSWSSPQALRAELRTLGRNLHPARHGGLRGRGWLQHLDTMLAEQLQRTPGDGRLQLTFEIIYGHAFKPQPRLVVRPQTNVSLEEMRKALSLVKKN